MTKQKSTKRALLLSALSLLMCVSMLIGSTFAWFTDSVTSGSNKIVSGNLDVVLEYKNDWAGDWKTVDETTKIFKEGALYEPGYTEVVFLRVSNAGSLALKYNLLVEIASEKGSVNVDGKDFKLSDHLQIGAFTQDEYASGANYADILMPIMFGSREGALSNVTLTKLSSADSVIESDAPVLAGDQTAQVMALVLTMPETVGNEANYDATKAAAPEINLGVSLVATQFTHENDSFDNQYDKDAKYPGEADVWDGTVDTAWYNTTETTFTLSTAEELVGLAELASNGTTFSGKTIELESNMDLDGEQWTPIKKFAGTLKGNDHTIGNFSVDATTGHGGFIDVMEWATVEDLILTDITATVGDYRFGTLARSINQSNIENVTVKNVNITTTAPTAFVAGLFGHGTVNSNMEVNNCTVENLTVNAEAGAYLIGGITDFVQKNGTEAEGTNIFENLNVKNFKITVNDTDDVCGVGGLVGQTQSVWQNPRFNNCTVTGLDVTAKGKVDVGGFICYPGSITFAENCTTEGKIDVSGVTSADCHAGGFFSDYGWGDNISKGDHKVTSCFADVDITTKYASAGGFVGSGTNSEGRNKNITLTNCEAKGTVTLVEGGTANIGGFAGQTDRGIYINCSAAQNPFIGKVLDGYTLSDDGNGTLTVTK